KPALHAQPAWRERMRRGGDHRGAGGGDQRHPRCVALPRCARHRNAGYAASNLASHNAAMIQSAFRAQEVNPAKLAQLYRRELELCQAKKGETIAVVSDLSTRREYIQAAFAAADDLGVDIYEICVNALPSWIKV